MKLEEEKFEYKRNCQKKNQLLESSSNILDRLKSKFTETEEKTIFKIHRLESGNSQLIDVLREMEINEKNLQINIKELMGKIDEKNSEVKKSKKENENHKFEIEKLQNEKEGIPRVPLGVFITTAILTKNIFWAYATLLFNVIRLRLSECNDTSYEGKHSGNVFLIFSLIFGVFMGKNRPSFTIMKLVLQITKRIRIIYSCSVDN
jgi:hypothetical protein